MENLTIVIQAGGESKRMGTSKALVPFCGQPLVCRLLERFGSIADELIITSNDECKLDFLYDDSHFGDKIKIRQDVLDTRGALNGLYTALHHASKPFVGIVAVDMVFASAPLLIAEYDALKATGADLAVPLTRHGYEPFHAVYRRDTCFAAVGRAISRGEVRANSWYDEVQVVEFTPEMVSENDPHGGAFINVNTPQELSDLEQRILDGELKQAFDNNWF